jgi:hypothetical protein
MSDHKNGIHGMTNDKLGPMDSTDLNRQTTTLTMQLSADQYERLFFQPEKPKGDLSKRFGTYLKSTRLEFRILTDHFSQPNLARSHRPPYPISDHHVVSPPIQRLGFDFLGGR